MSRKYTNLLIAYLLKCCSLISKILSLSSSRWFFGKTAQFLGKFSSRHKLTLQNLAYAYSFKQNSDIDAIAKKMWYNMGVLVAEYFSLNKIVGNSQKIHKNIIFENEHILKNIATSNKSNIFFTAHIGNFELLPICAKAYNIDMAILFRTPNNKYIAQMLAKIRKNFLPNIIPSDSLAIFKLTENLKNNKNIGILVDQKYNKGIKCSFFGKEVKTNPLAIKLAEKFNCDLYPAFCVRISNGKYKIILQEKLELIKDKNGKINVQANCQLLNDIVEQWVRDYPEQWMWFHNRWKV